VFRLLGLKKKMSKKHDKTTQKILIEKDKACFLILKYSWNRNRNRNRNRKTKSLSLKLGKPYPIIFGKSKKMVNSYFRCENLQKIYDLKKVKNYLYPRNWK